jgi:son of sevenless-like protein
MVTDDNILEKEDMYILERIKEFAATVDRDIVPSIPAAKQLLVNVERAVCLFIKNYLDINF